MKKLMLMAACAAMAGLLAAAVRAELVTRIVTVASQCGTYTKTEPGTWRLVQVLSTATGGTLTVTQDYMVGAAGSVTRTVGSLTILPPSNRVVSLPADVYVQPRQALTLTNSAAAVATYPVFLLFQTE